MKRAWMLGLVLAAGCASARRGVIARETFETAKPMRDVPAVAAVEEHPVALLAMEAPPTPIAFAKPTPIVIEKPAPIVHAAPPPPRPCKCIRPVPHELHPLAIE